MKSFLATVVRILGWICNAIAGFFCLMAVVNTTVPGNDLSTIVAIDVILVLIAFLFFRIGKKAIRRANTLKNEVTVQREQDAEDLEIEDGEDQRVRIMLTSAEVQSREAEQQRELEAKKRKANKTVFLTGEQIVKLEHNIGLPNLEDCELMLERNEIAVYGSTALWSSAKDTAVYSGHLYITNQRVGFVSEEKGFILSHDDIVAVGNKPEGIIIQMKQSSYSLELPRADLAVKVFRALRKQIPIEGVSDTGACDADKAAVSDISMVDGMEGHSFEYFCAELLEKNGFSNVEVTKGSGDQGVDIIALKDGIKYAIQCKNYASKLGNTPIQEVNAGKLFYNCHVGAVMTNSTFTPAAEQLAASTNVLLWDREFLNDLIKKTH